MAADVRSGATKRVGKPEADSRAYYLYAISQKHEAAEPRIEAEGIDGSAAVEPLPCEGYQCWMSRVSRDEFADPLPTQMENLEWLAAASLRHQRVVAEIARHMTVLPARFGTVFHSRESLGQHVRERRESLQQAFDHVADADEWGVKVFAVSSKPEAVEVNPAESGADYLKRKSKSLEVRHSHAVDEAVQEFVESLTAVAEGASPGGKASAGQPGLIWSGSFLIRRKDRKKFDLVLRQYAAKWHEQRRIDCSGPWPPYSFVGDHAR